MIKEIADECWEIKDYTIVLGLKGRFVCTCKGYFYRGRCKHIKALREFLEDRLWQWWNNLEVVSDSF